MGKSQNIINTAGSAHDPPLASAVAKDCATVLKEHGQALPLNVLCLSAVRLGFQNKKELEAWLGVWIAKKCWKRSLDGKLCSYFKKDNGRKGLSKRK